MSRVDSSGPPDNVHVIDREDTFVCWVSCPGCGLRARIDEEQYRGEVSMDCPACPYHATHDLREGS